MENRKARKRKSYDLDNITNTEIDKLINDRLHSKRDRLILHLRLVDGLTYMQTSDYLYEHEKIQLSERQIKRIVSKAETILFRNL